MSLDFDYSYSPIRGSANDNPRYFSWTNSIDIPFAYEEILASPNINLKEMFQRFPDLLLFFHRRQNTVTNKLIESFNDIIELLYESDEKNLISYIGQLFLSKNRSLLVLILNPNVIDYLALIIEGNNLYKIGVVSQIIINAFENWPSDLMSALYESNIFFPSILKNIDKTSIYLLTDMLIQKSNNASPAFLWGFFLSLMKNECSENPPPYWDISPKSISNCSETEISHAQRLLVLRVLNSFYNYFPNENQFRQIIIRCLPMLYDNTFKEDELVELLNFSINVPSNPKIIQIAIELAKKGDMNTIITEKAILFLTSHIKMVPIYDIINILYMLIMKSIPNNFVFRSAANLIQETIEKHSQSSLFIHAMQQIIAYCWNHPPHKSLMFKSFIVGYASIFGPVCSLRDWSSFYIDVVCPFSKWKPVSNLNFRFDEKKWNNQLLCLIKTNSIDFDNFNKKERRKSIDLELTSCCSKTQLFSNIKLRCFKSLSSPNLFLLSQHSFSHKIQSPQILECNRHQTKHHCHKSKKMVSAKTLTFPNKSRVPSHHHSHPQQNCNHQNFHHNLLISQVDSSKSEKQNLYNYQINSSHSNSDLMNYKTSGHYLNSHDPSTPHSHGSHSSIHNHNSHTHNARSHSYHSNPDSLSNSNSVMQSSENLCTNIHSNGHSNLLITPNVLRSISSNKKHKCHQRSNSSSASQNDDKSHSDNFVVNTKSKHNKSQRSCSNINTYKRKAQCNIS